MGNLPIEALRGDICGALSGGCTKFVVSAPTASGKSTRLPHIFWKSGRIDGMILVMQPRRVAARMLAKGVREIFGLGDEVGWHVRFDKNYGPSAKIVFVTEGILARMILSDPSLKGVGAIVFDEFHERNIYADLALALALRAKNIKRPDIVIAVCSASMDADGIANYLGDGTRKFECSGRLYPVDIRYAPPPSRDTPIWVAATSAFERIARTEKIGNFLIFMPGAYEISKTIACILESPVAKGFDILALHGDLPPRQQDAILAPSERRKIIVSTNVAETSLTIDGVKFVIDSGQVRVARFDSARGINTLLVERVSLASATQRAGRAGRTEPGVAVRLWRREDEQNFSGYISPEIKRLDLSQIILWLKVFGLEVPDIEWFESPDPLNVERAMLSLRELGAIRSDGSVTEAGKLMADFPAPPRYARLLVEGAFENCIYEAAMIAALDEVGRVKLPLENAFREVERDRIAASAASEPEEIIKLCLAARENSFDESFCSRMGIHASNARKVCASADALARIARSALRNISPKHQKSPIGERIARCVLSAFSDNVGIRLNKGTLACRFTRGRRGEIRKDSRNWADNVFAAMAMREQNISGGTAIMASSIVPVSMDLLGDMFAEDFSESSETVYSPEHKRVVKRKYIKFRDLDLLDEISYDVPHAEASKILRDEIVSGRIVLKNFDDTAKDFIERVNFVSKACPESGISAIDSAALSEIYEQMCYGMTSYSEVKNADVLKALREWLSPEQLSYLDFMAPRFAEMPRRRKPAGIKYDAALLRASVASYFKDFYDFDPSKVRICQGRIPLTCQLLSPRGIAVQTTSDLANFWDNGWPQVKKELKARYPKHFKPGDMR